MNFEYGDSENIIEIAKDIINSANEYNIEINNLFKKLTSISTETKEWIGTKANRYNQIVSLDKQQYLDFYENLKSFSNELINIANNIDNCVKMTQLEQEYKEI